MSTDTIERPQVCNTVLASHFPTLFMMREYNHCADLNGQLERLMLQLEMATTNIAPSTSNIGGYHSATTLFSRQEPAIVAVRELVQAALHEYVPKFLEANCHAPPTKLNLRLWGWGINMRAGDINFQHVHPDAKVSGVYYVSVPPPPKGASAEEGAIMFVDPRPRAHMNRVPNQTTEITVNPKAGMMILFPAYYEHAVIPSRGSGVRTCIAFNANF
jgi:uncharacterized protein (TIGR02466 family)